MRIAIIDQHGNPGGGVRFVRALAEGLAVSYPADEIAVFAASAVLATDAMRALVEDHANVTGVELEDAGTAVPAVRGGRVRAALRRVRPLVWLYRRARGLTDEVDSAAADPTFRFSARLIAQLEGFDVIYLAWPFFIEPADLPAPVVATFHDFNYRHGFANFTPEMVDTLERQVPGWLERVSGTICSTGFIGGELTGFYPGLGPAPEIIPLASFITSRPTSSQVAETVRRYRLPSRFVLCPTNIARHKNIEVLFKAQSVLSADPSAPPMVFCGWGTDLIGERMRGRIPAGGDQLEFLAAELKASGLRVGRDVHLLGYISDADVDALVAGSSLVVSASSYEAGSGPGLDAWLLGTPVALSGIPAHREQVELLGTWAAFFDETDPENVAATVREVLAADTREQVERSAASLSSYDWTRVAGRYHEVFERAVARGGHMQSVDEVERGVQ